MTPVCESSWRSSLYSLAAASSAASEAASRPSAALLTAEPSSGSSTCRSATACNTACSACACNTSSSSMLSTCTQTSTSIRKRIGRRLRRRAARRNPVLTANPPHPRGTRPGLTGAPGHPGVGTDDQNGARSGRGSYRRSRPDALPRYHTHRIGRASRSPAASPCRARVDHGCTIATTTSTKASPRASTITGSGLRIAPPLAPVGSRSASSASWTEHPVAVGVRLTPVARRLDPTRPHLASRRGRRARLEQRVTAFHPSETVPIAGVVPEERREAVVDEHGRVEHRSSS